ncbi:SOS response-associated peptidase [Halobacillus hunanensis]|uniref:SOS response-associated peptidase n=1 Tax=Halobacillus hunanensis TaxID=578214 RepID=UPI0009A66A53|nr:SOS response-associated peptidase [Halobacillus hunanensis]
MCGRFTLAVNEPDILKEFELSKPIEHYEPRYNIAPGQKVLAIIHDGTRKRAGYMKWGLVPSWAKDPKIGYKMINARSETVHQKPSFSSLLKRKRCLILADSFFEWKVSDGKKQPMRIKPSTRKVFAFAGLWDKWTDNGEELFTCTILTQAANEFMENIHHRMPVILGSEFQEQWIAPNSWESAYAHQLLQQMTMEGLEAHKVSTYVNSAKNEGAECIAPLT